MHHPAVVAPRSRAASAPHPAAPRPAVSTHRLVASAPRSRASALRPVASAFLSSLSGSPDSLAMTRVIARAPES
eukprot:6775651-Alexandrium_andersonii.AAC.1